MRVRYLAASLLALGLSLGCDNDGEGDEDSGTAVDGGSRDAGRDGGRDAGRDAGRSDSGPPDSGTDAFVPVCGADTDGASCPDGHCCGGECVSNDDVAHCGNRCTPCTAPDLGTATCDGTMCSFTCADGRVPLGDACVTADMIPAPRPIEPASTAFTLSASVRFRWTLPEGVTGAHLQICSDAACSDVVQELDASGDTVNVDFTPMAATFPASCPTPPTPCATPLTDRLRYWRVAGRVGTTNGTTYGTVWTYNLRGSAGAEGRGSWGTNIDTNRDGFADVVVGAPSSNFALVYRGSSTPIPNAASAETRLDGPTGGDFGAAAAGAGDVNGDGFGDIAVGSPSTNQVFVYHGGASGLAATIASSEASATIGGSAGSAALGTSVAAAGDVNRDGYGDLLIGSPGDNRAYVYLGSDAGLVTATPIVLMGPDGSAFGRSVDGAGDINGDGYGDIIVGAPMANEARVFLGRASGIDPSQFVALTGDPSTEFGFSVSSAGDVNRDGYGDVLVGAPGARSVLVYHGATDGLDTTPDGAVRKADINLGYSVDAIGDPNADGMTDIASASTTSLASPNNRIAFAYFAGALGGVATGFPSQAPQTNGAGHCNSIAAACGATVDTPCALGVHVAGLGDINGDGYDDFVYARPQASTIHLLPGGGVNTFAAASCRNGLPSGGRAISGTAMSGFGGAIAEFIGHDFDGRVCRAS